MGNQFILLKTINGNKIAVRPNDVIMVKECKGIIKKIELTTKEDTWNIDAGFHSVEGIIQEINDINESNKEEKQD